MVLNTHLNLIIEAYKQNFM